ncbi:MAG: class I SAM-dependent methyltransferase [Deltaproteobacteria bacterium]|nr:class I SAM-dependent methyltransferase [Deltaproteobacteria bacterium]
MRWNSRLRVRHWRARIAAAAIAAVPPPARVLDVGCGDGADASVLVAAGYDVQGIDVSPKMVARARARGLRAELGDADRLPVETCDLVLANFGVVNCIASLDGLSRGAARALRPGGVAMLVTMCRHAPMESLSRVARGRWPRRRGEAHVAGQRVPVYYRDPGELVAAFSHAFDAERVEGLGVLVPPPDEGGAGARLAGLDALVSRLPIARRLGDHALVVLRRR